MSDEAEPYTSLVEVADRDRLSGKWSLKWSLKAMFSLDEERFLATVRALDASKKRIGELEAKLELKRNTCTTHAGARMACGQCHDSLKARIVALEAKSALALEAAKAALKRICEAFGCEPSDADDAVEAARLLVAERDAARERIKKLRLVEELQSEIEKWKDSVSIIMREAEVEHRRRSDERDAARARVRELEGVLRSIEQHAGKPSGDEYWIRDVARAALEGGDQ